MHTSGYLHDRLNAITSVAGQPLNSAVYETYLHLITAEQNTPRNLHRLALRYILETTTSCASSEDIFGVPFVFDPYWGGALSVNRMEYECLQEDTEVILQVIGPTDTDPLLSSRISQEYRLSHDTVVLDDEIPLFTYQAVGLGIDLLAATNTPALARVNKLLRG